MTANTAFTISNPQFNEVITLKLQGNFTRTWPASLKKLAGEYDPTKVNVYHIHCVNATAGSEKYHFTISQEN